MASRSAYRFLGFYTQNLQNLRLFVARRTAGHDVDDLTQEAFLKVFEAAESNPKVLSEPFLKTVARNLVIDRGRRLAVRQEPADAAQLAETVADPRDNPEAACLKEQRKALIKRALAEMSPIRRQIFLMRKYEGLSQAEVAERLGLSVSSVEKHVMGAMAAFRALVKAEEEGEL